MATNIFKTVSKLATSVAVISAAVLMLSAKPAHAAVSQPTPVAQVSFTFDDGLLSTLTEAAPTLAGYGIEGTAYITTGCIGSVGTCEADEAEEYLSWEQLSQLQALYNWEIGGHSVSHPLMSELRASQLETEAANSKAVLEAHGFSPKAFATPYGDYNSEALAAIAKYYTSHRGFADTGYNTWPYNPYLLRVQQVQAGVSVATVKGYIDQAKTDNTWLILVFHNIQDTPNADPEEYEYSTADLAEIAAYVQASGIKDVKVTDGLVVGQDNLMPDSNNLQNGWTSDAPSNVTVDTTSKGSFPEPVKSVKIVAQNQKTTHLFSPTVVIDPSKTYYVNGYINITRQQRGDIGIYIDEYDASGNWISGQYKQTIFSGLYKDLSFIYNATSPAVAKARLQIIVPGRSGITAYLDNIGWYSTSPSTVPTPEPTPAETVVLNTSFQNGIANGWTTDSPATITADNTGKGAADEPTNSIKLVSATANKHLFSPKVEVNSSKTYKIQGYLNIVALQTGEIGFYIDEYDVNGNWVSGKYVYAKRSVGSETFNFNYTPTSTNVASASLQVIVTGNSGITAYLDNIKWAY